MIQTFADTGFFLALVSKRDALHAQARELSALYEGEPLLTTEAVLLEVGNGLARGLKREAIALFDSLYSSPELEIVRLTPAVFTAGMQLYRDYADKEWGMVDCVSFVVMRERAITDALTPDVHYTQAGFRALMREAA